MKLNIQPIIYKTELLLKCPANEILLGGSLGGAKSTSLVIDAGIYAMRNPGVNIIMIRQSFVELERTVISKFTDIFPREVYEYKSSQRRGFFSNGSVVNFGYLETDSDLGRHQSAEYQYLGWDEATHNTEFQHRSLKKRVRSPFKGVPTRIVYAANPGGASHQYFYQRYMKNKTPYMIYETEETKGLEEPRTQCFIKSGLIDNPYIFENDPNYKYMLLEMTEAEKEMYLYGNWEINAGQFFKEWDEKKHIIDDYKIQADDQLFITCDYGTSKPSAVYWCALTRTGQIIAYRELYTMRMNEPDVGDNCSATELAKRILDLTPKDETIQLKYMVLDNACWSNLGHGQTIYHLIKKVLPWTIIKTNKERIAGWQHFRYYLEATNKEHKPYFQCTKTCKNLIRTLPALVHSTTDDKDLNSKQEDHCFIAGTKIETKNGEKNIEDIQIGDLVLTRKGYKKVYSCGLSRENAEVFEYKINDITVTCTPEHRILINNEWKRIDTISYCDMIYTKDGAICETIKKLYSIIKNIDDMTEKDIMSVLVDVMKMDLEDYMQIYGNQLTEKHQKDMQYIMSILTTIITTLKTYSLYQKQNIVDYMQLEIKKMKSTLKKTNSIWRRLENLPKNGMQAKKVVNGIYNMVKMCLVILKTLNLYVNFVEKNMKQKKQCKIDQSFVALTASKQAEEKQKQILKKEFVIFVEKNFHVTRTMKQKHVQENVVQSFQITKKQKQNVYDISVEECPEFFANGLLVHNCVDSLRYLTILHPKQRNYSLPPNRNSNTMPLD